MKTNNTMIWLGVLLMGVLVLPMAVYTPRAAAVVPLVQNTGSSEPDIDIHFYRPLDSGRVTLAFEEAVDPYTGETFFHNGIDIKSEKGNNIYAAANGTVVEAVRDYVIDKGRGRYVERQTRVHQSHAIRAQEAQAMGIGRFL